MGMKVTMKIQMGRRPETTNDDEEDEGESAY